MLSPQELSISNPTVSRASASGLRRSPAACLALWIVVRLYQLAFGCSGEGTDVALYRQYADQLRSGAAASPDFRPEYPPGALTLFMLPGLSEPRYHRAFLTLMGLFDLAACLLVFHRARLRPHTPARSPLFHAMVYLAMTAVLWPVLYARFDIAPAALVLAALHCLDRHRERVSAVLLGLAGAIKLWPFALFPLWIVWEVRPGQPRHPRVGHTLKTGVWIGVGAAIGALPVLTLLGTRIASSARYHADRGLQIESTWATLVLILDRLNLAEAGIEEAFGSVQLTGRLASILTRVSMPATLALVAIPTIALYARRQQLSATHPPVSREGHGHEWGGSALEHAVLAVVAGCMIAAKVLSPQFILWVAPLIALVATGPATALLAFLTAALTTEVYPHLYPALMRQEGGHSHALIALAARNGLLIGWYVLAVRRLMKQRAPLARLEAGAGTLPGPILPLRPRGYRS